MKPLTILAQLFAAYPTVEVSEATVAMYLRLLSDIPTETLRTAIDHCITHSTYLPTIAEIRTQALRILHPPPPPWEDAWLLLQKAIRRCGVGNKPTFHSNPVLAQTVDVIGWKELCLSETPHITRAHFRDVYTSLAQRTQEQRTQTHSLPQPVHLLQENSHA